MAKNKIITSQGNVQFINSKGKIINMHPMHCYAVYENDTVSFLFVYMKDYSGQAFFTSQYEDLEVNGETYDNIDDLKDAITYAFAKAGAQARTEIVDELPEDPFTNTIYLVAKQHGEGYDEYIWNEDGGWQLIGDTDIEFERYLQIADFNPYSAATKDYIDLVSGNTVQNAADIVVLSGAIDTEVAAREAADAYISGAVDTNTADIASEASRAIAAETALGNRIDTVNSRVDAEQLARVQADTALSGAIDTEISNRESADTALQTAIDNEVSARTDADTALDNKISAVSGAVDAEIARATSAETTLNTAINTEASARRNADDAILGKIDAVSGAVDTEITNRTDADTALQNAIDAEAAARVTDVAALSGAVDTMGDDKADKASAVASAEYVSSSTTIDLKNISGDVISQVDASDFIIDGMVDDVKIENGYLVITFNTDAGKQDIQIPLTDIFDPSNYYDKNDVDGFVGDLEAADSVISGAVDTVSSDLATEAQRAQDAEGALSDAVDTKLAISDFNTYSGNVETELSEKADSDDVYAKAEVYTKSEVDASQLAQDNKIDTVSGAIDTKLTNYYTKSETSGKTQISTALDAKQNTLSAGRAIDITSDVVSFTLPISAGTGENSVVEGSNTKAYGNNCHAEGRGSTAGKSGSNNGYSSHAEGEVTLAEGNMSHSEGNHTQANGVASHAEGSYTKANGAASHAEGSDTRAFNDNEHASGKFNVSTKYNTTFGSNGNTIFSVGNGIGDTKRHNTIEVKQNGDVYIADTSQITGTGSGETEGHNFYDVPMINLQDALESKQGSLTAGNGIDITSDVISCDLPISAGTGVGSLLMSGSGNTASGDYSVAYGKLNTVAGTCGLVNGNRNTSNNFAEAAFGQMNISRTEDASSFGHSGNTIYTIGNGVINASGESKNHNAFEVRGNGDIYIANTNATGSYYDKPMIKLQDHLGGGGSSYTAGDGIDITNNVISVTGKVDTSAFTAYSADVQSEISTKVTGEWVDNELLDYVNKSAYDEFTSTTETRLTEDEEVTAAGLNALNESLSGKVDTTDFETYTAATEARIAEDEEVTAAGLNAVNDKFGGLKLEQITQSAYDALTTKDPSTLYIITE